MLPEHEFDNFLIVQDRSFRTDGSVFYPQAEDQPPGTLGANPDVNPYWMLIVNGSTNLVNGKVWPNMDVKRHLYRFRMLDSADQRFYKFSLSNGMPVRIIGTDGGYKNTAETVTSWQMGVTERNDILIDFSNIPVGTKIVLQNTAPVPQPVGPAPGSQHRRHRHAVHRGQQRLGAAQAGADQSGPAGPGAHARPARAPPDPERGDG